MVLTLVKQPRSTLFLSITIGAAIGAAVVVFLWSSSRPLPIETILSKFDNKKSQSLSITLLQPFPNAVFPPEFPPPTFIWNDHNRHSRMWVIRISFGDGNDAVVASVNRRSWRPSVGQWEEIKRHSLGQTAEITIVSIQKSLLSTKLDGASFSIGISADSVGAPIFYREVILPFIEAVKDPAQITWRFGAVSSTSRPPAVLKGLPVCGNCHSFSKDGAVLGMDVDYANDKGAYAIVQTSREITLSKEVIISWADFKRNDGEPTFGLLSSVSPDGRYVLSTVKDRSIFVPRPDLAYSQLFFPIKGIIVYYDRLKKKFASLPGASDKRYVQSNPQWSHDGKEILFIRTDAYPLPVGTGKSVLVSAEEEKEFFRRCKEFKYDIYRVPFNNGKGGVAEPLLGASLNGMSNYFPRYSPDGKWIVFCQARSYCLLQPDSKLFIIPSGGGKPRLMRCNTARMNSWHSWSPNGKWLVFSSKHNGPYTQLFLTHIDENGDDTPPVLLENFTAPDRAANIAEFVSIKADAIERIQEQFVDDVSYSRKGMDLVKVGDFTLAEQSFLKAIKINSQNAQAHTSLALIYAQQNKDSAAAAHFSAAIKLNPNNAAVYYNLGLWNEKRRNVDSAIICYRKAIACDPSYVEAYNNLGYVLARRGEHAEAEKCFRKALEINPSLDRVRANLDALLRGEFRP